MGESQESVAFPFDEESGQKQYVVGTNPQSDLKLPEGRDASPTHAEIHRNDEFSLRTLPAEVQHKILCLGTFLTNYQMKDSTFNLSSSARHGTIIYRRCPFLVEPGSIENFQFGDLLVQISRY